MPAPFDIPVKQILLKSPEYDQTTFDSLLTRQDGLTALLHSDIEILMMSLE